MIIFLYGSDSYRSKQKVNDIVEHYKKSQKSGLNLMYLDLAQIDFSDFYSHLTASAMFAEKKLIILKNAFANKIFQEDFLAEIKKIEGLDDVVVMYEMDAPDKRLKLFKVLTKECKSQEFNLLDSKQLKIWTQKEFEKREQKINLDALEMLTIYVGNDLWRFAQEIDKLSNFKRGATIKKEDVGLQVRPNLEVDIFKTIDALATKNKKMAFLLLRKHLDSGDHPLKLLSMIEYQFRNLLVVKELAEKGLMYNSIVNKSGLHPFVVKKNYFACQQFSFPELKKIYRTLFQLDLDIKNGKIESETALELFVSKV